MRNFKRQILLIPLLLGIFLPACSDHRHKIPELGDKASIELQFDFNKYIPDQKFRDKFETSYDVVGFTFTVSCDDLLGEDDGFKATFLKSPKENITPFIIPILPHCDITFDSLQVQGPYDLETYININNRISSDESFSPLRKRGQFSDKELTDKVAFIRLSDNGLLAQKVEELTFDHEKEKWSNPTLNLTHLIFIERFTPTILDPSVIEDKPIDFPDERLLEEMKSQKK